MKLVKLICVSAALLAVAGIASAADVSGTWVAHQMREGRAVDITFDFKVAGDKLTGTYSPAGRTVAFTDGKVSGNKISFAVVRTVEEKTTRVEYNGILSGDELKIVATRDGKQVLECSAKRTK